MDAATGIAQLQAFLRTNPTASPAQVQAEVLRLANLIDVSAPQGATTNLYSGIIGKVEDGNVSRSSGDTGKFRGHHP